MKMSEKVDAALLGYLENQNIKDSNHHFCMALAAHQLITGQTPSARMSLALAHTNGHRKIYYTTKEENNSRRLTIPHTENFCNKFMVVGALSGRGVLPLIKVPQKVKVTTKYFIDFVLKPLLEIHVPKPYGKDTKKVIVHHDAASSHTALLTQDYAKDLKARLGITIIQNSEMPVKSLYVSPMDLFGFGYLKQNLFSATQKLLTEFGKLWETSGLKLTSPWSNQCTEVEIADADL
ncbi:hypothetical protein Fcan01_23296 [Folsomia candida]|uniref:Uncharacterized protein n=1 Tax=Folsomia candida TaxID=158441 RepID=A0A226DAA2_FOLCA|nr:hypothetical protein Fcan01_23296 [Folsomia candida]